MQRLGQKLLTRAIANGTCLELIVPSRTDGYPQVWFEGRMRRAHRVIWTIFNGTIPSRLWVLHHCDNRRCINLDHLYLGNHKDNTRDMVVRGRTVTCGTDGGAPTLLTQEQIMQIRLIGKGRRNCNKMLAEQFGVSRATIYRARYGKGLSYESA
jgi:hypothetical protein